MEIINLSQNNPDQAISEAVKVIKRGGLVIYPTETVYGVAVDATNPEAVSRLLLFKNRPAGKAISVLLADREQAEQYVDLNAEAADLYDKFLPGPLTIISMLKSGNNLDRRLLSELGNLGVRVSSHPLAMALAVAVGRPLTATSANASGKGRPYAIQDIMAGLIEKQAGLVDLVLDAGRLPRNDPSTVIDTTQTTQTIVRAGAWLDEAVKPFISRSEEDTVAYGLRFMRSNLHH